MNTIEDRLREALRERASHSPIDPDAWERTVARSRRRRWAWAGVRHRAGAWSRLLIPVAAAAAVVAVVIGATVLTGRVGQHAGPGRSPTAAPSPTPPAPPGRGNYGIQQVPPTSAIVPIKTGSGRQVFWTFVWFGYDIHYRSEGIQLCSDTYSGGFDDGGGCGPVHIPAGQVAAGEGGDGDIRLGVSVPKVASVAAQLPGGHSVPGVLVSGRGFPYRVWAVQYPTANDATVVFRDAAGHEAGHLFIQGNPPWPHRPGSGGIAVFRYPAGTEAPKAGVMTGYLIGGKVVFWNSDGGSSMSDALATGPPAVGLFQGAWSPKLPEVEFYGYAHENVARVVLRLGDGRQYGAQTFAAWPRSGLRLWAFAVPTRVLDAESPRKDVFTGYDASGRVVWQRRLLGGS